MEGKGKRLGGQKGRNETWSPSSKVFFNMSASRASADSFNCFSLISSFASSGLAHRSGWCKFSESGIIGLLAHQTASFPAGFARLILSFPAKLARLILVCRFQSNVFAPHSSETDVRSGVDSLNKTEKLIPQRVSSWIS